MKHFIKEISKTVDVSELLNIHNQVTDFEWKLTKSETDLEIKETLEKAKLLIASKVEYLIYAWWLAL